MTILADFLKDSSGHTWRLYPDGEGGFTHRKKKIIITISNQLELPKIKEIILNLDPDAFIVVSDTSEVLGKRFSMGCVY